MTLTPEQKKAVSEWVAAGDSLYAVQKKLSDQFKISMTYMDVRFLVDDLNLQLKDPEPEGRRERRQQGRAGRGEEGLPGEGQGEARPFGGRSPGPAEDDEELEAPAPTSGVRVTVDKVNLNPNAMASGTVTFRRRRDWQNGWWTTRAGRRSLS